MAGDDGSSRPAREPERAHPPGGVRQLQEPGHALVHREGQHGPALAGAEGVLRARADSADPHRHRVQDPGDDRVPGPAGARVESDHDLRPEPAGAGGEADLPRRRRRPDRLLQGAQDRRAQAHAERRVAALPAQPHASGRTSWTGTPSRSPASSSAPGPTRKAAAPRSATSRPARRSRSGTSAISRPSSGTSSRPSSRRAPTCGSTRCSTGPSSTSGSTSSGRTSRRCRSTTIRANGKRYRSLGCYPCTHAVESDARNVDEIIVELQTGQVRQHRRALGPGPGQGRRRRSGDAPARRVHVTRSRA